MASHSLQLKVCRCEVELITPSKPTPLEVKPLSDIDDQETFRFQSVFIHSYSANVKMEGKDPAKVLRYAIADALVFYYPFAGRLRERPGRKLVVDCTGEGVAFIEAHADVRLDQFGDTLLPPCPWIKELLYDAPGTIDILHCPLLTIQVTKLKCRGFILAYRFNHPMCDGLGLVLFLNAVAEMARGATNPSVKPTWERELLRACNDPSPTGMLCDLRQYNEKYFHRHSFGIYRMVHRNFFFSSQDTAVLKKHLPFHLRKCASFDILTACLWRCRVFAYSLPPEAEVQLILTLDVRRTYRPQLSAGFYGNAIALPAAFSTAGELCHNPVSYALDLVKNAKSSATAEYMRSTINFMVTNGRPVLRLVRAQTFVVSDLANVGLGDIDFGWGKAVYVGTPASNFDVLSPCVWYRNKHGVEGRLVPISLPGPVMEKFEMEMGRMIREPPSESPILNKL